MPKADSQIVLKTLVAEAGGEGEESMYHVASTMVNRARRRKLSLEQVVNQPFQYAGRWRKDLDTFAASQPTATHIAAGNALVRAQVSPASSATHYLTKRLFQSPKRPHWVNHPKMRRIGTVGQHIFFEETR